CCYFYSLHLFEKVMKKLSLIGVIWFLVFHGLSAQSAFAPLDRDYYHLLDRYLLLHGQGNPKSHTAFKPYRRDAIVALVDSWQQKSSQLNRVDQFNLT